MLTSLLLAALALAQPSDPNAYEVYDRDVAGWTVVRRGDGCFMFTTFRRGSHAMSFNLHYNVTRAETPLALLFSSTEWRLTEEVANGYRLDFAGARPWTDLSAYTFTSQREDDDGRTGAMGVIALNFTAEAAGDMLADVARGGEVTLSHNGREIERLALDGAPAALRRLMDCVRSFPGRTIPRYGFEGG